MRKSISDSMSPAARRSCAHASNSLDQVGGVVQLDQVDQLGEVVQVGEARCRWVRRRKRQATR